MRNAQDDRAAGARRLEQTIRDFYAACNTGDLDALTALFTPDAVHYFPAGIYGSSEPYRGGRTIAELWARRSSRSARASTLTPSSPTLTST